MSVLLGRGWQFPPRFDPTTKQLLMVADEPDIEESLRILFSTTPGERVMNPAYGCDLRHLVFGTLNEHTLTDIRERIRKAILFFEPRIILHRVDARIRDAREGRLDLLLDFSVRTTNTRHNLVYPLYLDQATSPVSGT